MTTLYRGTQRLDPGGIRKSMSFTDSKDVAIIWSAVPADVLRRSKAKFVPSSTLHTIEVDTSNALDLGDNSSTLGNVLRLLEGISHEEVLKILNYMHNRLTGRAKGGEFSFHVLDEDGNNPLEEEEVFGFSFTQTLISWFRDEWDYSPSIEEADRVVADTFIFADAPAVQRAALRLGYDWLTYRDVFEGGRSASIDLLKTTVGELEGVKWERDLNWEKVPTHQTYRLLNTNIDYDLKSETVYGRLEEME